MKLQTLLTSLLCMALLGCNNDNDNNGIVCTTVIVPGIEVDVRDALTDAPLAENAMGVITEGNYREEMQVTAYENQDPSSAYLLAGAYERSGVYNIVVTLDGYTTWSRNNVQVRAGVCHVETVRFTARMEK